MTYPKCPECGTVLVINSGIEICVKRTCPNYGKEPKLCESGS